VGYAEGGQRAAGRSLTRESPTQAAFRWSLPLPLTLTLTLADLRSARAMRCVLPTPVLPCSFSRDTGTLAGRGCGTPELDHR
jgi:hypothetical protein